MKNAKRRDFPITTHSLDTCGFTTWQDAYERDGYAILRGFYQPFLVNHLRADILNALSLMGAGHASPIELQVRNGFPAILFQPRFARAPIREMVHGLKDVVWQILGPDVFHLVDQYYFRLPGDGDEFAWHQDISFRQPPEAFDDVESRYLQTAIIVDGMSPDNGAIEFIPGSHKWGDKGLIPRDGSEKGLREFQRGNWHGVKVSCAPGDLLIWHAMTVHGSEPNNSHMPRGYYMNGFAAAGAVKDKAAFPWYMRDGRLA